MNTAVNALYFSPTHGSRKIALTLAGALASALDKKRVDTNLTTPTARKKALSFGPDAILILGFPVYAGRVPELLVKTLQHVAGKGTPAIIVATYGNRDYDDALLEARDILTQKGFTVIAAGAFIAEHSFTQHVAANRPDPKDLDATKVFAQLISEKIREGTIQEVTVTGKSPYKERKAALHIVPETSDECSECMRCAQDCPTGAIDMDDPFLTDSNLCIQCCACIKFCPLGARSFEDARILQLVSMLEKNCKARKEPELFL